MVSLILILILFYCLFMVFLFWISPYIRRGRGKPWKPIEVPKIKLKLKLFSRKPDVEMERSLVVLGMSPKKFRLGDLSVIAGMGFYEFLLTRDLLSTVFYVFAGRMLYRAYLALKAAYRQQLQDAQTLQFVRGMKDNLGIEGNLLEAVRNSAGQLKEPMRSELVLAVNITRGNRTLPEAMKELGARLKNPVYVLLSRIMEKGLNEGQREMAFAFEQVEKNLREGEKMANKRAAKIRTYLNWVSGLFVFGLATPLLELVFRSDVWRETVTSVHWAWGVGAIMDLFLAAGLKKFTRLYVRRGGLMAGEQL